MITVHTLFNLYVRYVIAIKLKY
uniref:Uncharacterized protein n=1 Tax=Arundo donax TaxID=35708 RepID=A0A0A9S8S5_ARUDO